MEITKEEALIIYLALYEQVKRYNEDEIRITTEGNLAEKIRLYLTKN